MKITAFANFADPQTLPMYQALSEKSGGNLILAVTEPVEEDLLKNGHPDYNETTPYVLKLYEESDPLSKAKQLAAESDVLIYGHCPVDYFNLAVKSGKPVFRLSQHIYRDGNLKAVPLKWKLSYFVKHTLALFNKPVYLMCLGTYTAQDFSLTDSYRGKMFEFGEFTPVISYAFEDLMAAKQSDPVKIVWINDFHPWFRPDTVLELAERMSDQSCVFELYGNGELADSVKEQALKLPNVRISEDLNIRYIDEALRNAGIFLSTSSYNAGWENTLNQAMNHACACVVSTAVGASKMLGRNENGLLYRYDDINDLEDKMRRLVKDRKLREGFSKAAFEANRDIWNGNAAGERFYELMEALLAGKPSPFADGLCSPAKIVTQEEMNKRAAE